MSDPIKRAGIILGILMAAVAAYVGGVYGGHHRDDGRIFSGLSYRYKRS